MPPAFASGPSRPRPAAARRPYLLRLGAAAAVVVVLTLSGVAAEAGSAEPGDALWGVSKVFYAERARSVQAAVDVEVGLERVRVALREGNPEAAAAELAAVREKLPVIREDEGRGSLAQQEQQLSNQLADDSRAVPPTAEGPTEPTDAVRADAGPPAGEPAPPAAAAPAVEPGPVTAAAASTTATGSRRGAGSTETPTATASVPEEPSSSADTTAPDPTVTNSRAPTTEPAEPETSGEAGPSNTASSDSTEPSQPRSDSTDPPGEGRPAAGPGDGSSETG